MGCSLDVKRNSVIVLKNSKENHENLKYDHYNYETKVNTNINSKLITSNLNKKLKENHEDNISKNKIFEKNDEIMEEETRKEKKIKKEKKLLSKENPFTFISINKIIKMKPKEKVYIVEDKNNNKFILRSYSKIEPSLRKKDLNEEDDIYIEYNSLKILSKIYSKYQVQDYEELLKTDFFIKDYFYLKETKIYQTLNKVLTSNSQKESFPYLVKVFDTPLRYYLLLDYKIGENLSYYQYQKEGFSLDEKFTIAKNLIECLIDLENAKIIHADIKRDNVILEIKNGKTKKAQKTEKLKNYNEEELKAKVIDFDLSMIPDIFLIDNTEKTGKSSKYDNILFAYKNNSVVGTKSYLSPEIVSEQLFSNKSDVWAFGILLSIILFNFQLELVFTDVEGKKRFNFKELAKFHDYLEKEKKDSSGKRLILLNIISDCLIKDLQQRPSASILYKKFLTVNK